MKTDFHSILREKLSSKENISDNTSSLPHSYTVSPTEPLHMAFLLGNLTKIQVQQKGLYPQKTSLSFNTTSDSLLPPTPPQHLSSEQQESWLWFWKRGMPLNENFSRFELQKHFRKLALIMHPDKNAHPRASDNFMKLREHFEKLSAPTI